MRPQTGLLVCDSVRCFHDVQPFNRGRHVWPDIIVTASPSHQAYSLEPFFTSDHDAKDQPRTTRSAPTRAHPREAAGLYQQHSMGARDPSPAPYLRWEPMPLNGAPLPRRIDTQVTDEGAGRTSANGTLKLGAEAKCAYASMHACTTSRTGPTLR